LRAVGGSSKAPSMLEVQAAVDDANERLAEAGRTCERLRFDLARLDDELAAAQRSADAALAALHESDAAMAALAEQLAHLGGVARSARAEGLRIADAISAAEQARDRDLEGLADLERRVAQADDTPADEDDGAELARLGDVASALRADETETRLALRTAEERCRALAARAEQMEQQVAVEQRARTQAAARREQLLREAAAARAVAAAAASTLTRLDRSLAAAATLRAEVEQARAVRERQLSTVREGLRGHEAELAGLTDSVHRDEVARAEQRLRLEALEQRALDEVGLDADTLVADFGPDNADGFDRDEQARRLRAAERTLAQLGRINPLALEEFAALEERHQFLGEQLEDVRKTRRDLLDIISDVDSRVLQVFSEAYSDVEREFEAVFARLFPGGEGRLTLTDPGDLLSSGVDVEARPPGKKVKRLSLLSGGERSLVAVAFLVSLFKARPSPFYILDEVEAALDDTNLGRVLDIYEELRADSQLLVITHQKRTMGVGDALYGVSMRDDGVSVVISQRLREAASA
ncbi:MAG: AAA family ATPase, partial [Actinomycetota bacterium]|nr:AAA family ATPase [Actinomycetota bacterium]